MAAAINQAKTSISKMFNGEPRSYTRFSLAQNADGDEDHHEDHRVEMKITTDAEYESGVPDHAQAPGTSRQSPLFTPKNICFLVLSTLFIFILGYLVGYVSPHKSDLPAACPTSVSIVEKTAISPTFSQSQGQAQEPPKPQFLDWDVIVNLLQQKLDRGAISDKIRDFTLSRTVSHVAGSDGDQELANKVQSSFKTFGMQNWVDEHFVSLPFPSSDVPNKVSFGAEEIGTTKGFLAYSKNGTKTGRVVYANYGTAKDLADIIDKVNLTGSVLLLRAGQISFAKKVAIAAEHGAAAVLIYSDPADYDFDGSTELYGHVHLGSGDPYTPGFPSFKHTLFPPSTSSGLPSILAQTITADMALKIFQKMGGDSAPDNFRGRFGGVGVYKLGNAEDLVTVSVNNVLTETLIHNVFGVIEGNEEPDRYVVIGAQRDSWGPGLARSTVGTTVLVEIARAVTDMIRYDHLSLRRSLVFASWSGGEYGNMGSTEWQEGYLSSLNMKAVTYINLDGVVTGRQNFKASASPLLYRLLEETMKEVKNPRTSKSVFDQYTKSKDLKSVLKDMKLDDAAYPFLALSGIPSISFSFYGDNEDYPYYGTALDELDHLNIATGSQLSDFVAMAGQLAGQMAVRLAHNHLLFMDVTQYRTEIKKMTDAVRKIAYQLKQENKPLPVDWLNSAEGYFGRAARDLQSTIADSSLEDDLMCRIINDRIIKMEHNLLSPYVTVTDAPFRHILYGSGKHTIQALLDHLSALKTNAPESDLQDLLKQFAFVAWTIENCANDLAGPVWK